MKDDDMMTLIRELIMNWQKTVLALAALFLVLLLSFPSLYIGMIWSREIGWLPSVYMQTHEKQTLMIWQNQIMLSAMFGLKHAECLNKAEADGADVEWIVTKFMRRCDDANDRMNKHLQSIGVPKLKQGD